MSQSIAVALRAADPAATTALEALRRVMPDDAPESLLRFDLWEFGSLEDRSGAQKLVSAYTDIVNPNKQVYGFVENGMPPLPRDGRTWVCVTVEDLCSSSSESWTGLLERAGFGSGQVRIGVLWALGYAAGTAADEAVEKAGRVAVSVSRRQGLLSNPVSQTATLSPAWTAQPETTS